ncbi:low molecular weight protein arginine phosphatase [Clostridium manihotivorum]|uniref:Protein tyrosine phosphatase n=1 Tax=Clostridium manihotivorum TaxID=2320868 RepID=A0A410DQW4_9CLOT|nr:low molecular weight protein arginine phosphatase [Clostridium manihotivorum]QAA31427.1 protein tyrosine phosphatase [Clostridium manihotivorum]
MNILFVCTGNTCRSCMAEAIFNNKCDIDNVKAYSAGLSIVPGSRTSKHSAELVMNNLSMDISKRSAVQLTADMIKSADLILTMTNYMRDLISSNFPEKSNNVYSVSQYAGVNGEISDPYGGSIDVYSKTYDQLENIIGKVLIKLKEDKGIL